MNEDELNANRVIRIIRGLCVAGNRARSCLCVYSFDDKSDYNNNIITYKNSGMMRARILLKPPFLFKAFGVHFYRINKPQKIRERDSMIVLAENFYSDYSNISTIIQLSIE